MKKSSVKTLSQKTISSPLGKLNIVASDQGVVMLSYNEFAAEQRKKLRNAEFSGKNKKAEKIIKDTSAQLKRYFAGSTSALNRVKTDASIGTEFQNKVWKAMRKIKAGDVMTYGALARKAGFSGAARAVGSACRNNPIALVVPCHRVVGSNGSLTGYRGGLQRKRKLLSLEGA